MVPWPLPLPDEDPPPARPTASQSWFWSQAGPSERYRAAGILSSGGQARLWRAVDTRTAAPVVVKMLREDRAGRPEALRLIREGRILHDLTGSPAIMELLDCGPPSLLRTAWSELDPGDDPSQSAFPWLVLPLHRHRRLDGALRELGPFGTATGLQIGRELARAIAHLHRNGVVHRDVSPGNVLLTESGLVLADFGVAWTRSYRDAGVVRPMTTGLTSAAGLPHTPGWAAPEVDPRDAEDRSSRNPAADVYGWGLYVAAGVLGRHPWAAAGQAPPALRGDGAAMRTGAAPALDGITDRRLRDVVEAALARDPADRPTAAELVDALAATPAGTAWPRPRGSSGIAGRLRSLRPSLGVTAVVLLIVAVLLMWASGVFTFLAGQLWPFEQRSGEPDTLLGSSLLPVFLVRCASPHSPLFRGARECPSSPQTTTPATPPRTAAGSRAPSRS